MMNELEYRDDDQAMNRKAVTYMGGAIVLMTVLLTILTLIAVRVTWAGEDTDRMGPPMPFEANEEFETAMSDCMDTVELDDNGRPDRDAMDECMSEKGFERPDGPPPGESGRREPPGFAGMNDDLS